MGRSLHRELVPPQQLAFAPQLLEEEKTWPKDQKIRARKEVTLLARKSMKGGPVDQIPINIRTGFDTIVVSELVADVLPN